MTTTCGVDGHPEQRIKQRVASWACVGAQAQNTLVTFSSAGNAITGTQSGQVEANSVGQENTSLMYRRNWGLRG